MTQEEMLKAIRAEIERRMKEYDAIIANQDTSMRAERSAWKWAECKSLLSFIDSLQDEQPSKDLKEAAEEYTQRMLESWRFDSTGCRPPRESFIAGAKWQKEQMLKDAVEGEVHRFGGRGFVKEENYSALMTYLDKFKDGDKVKIIIVKEDER